MSACAARVVAAGGRPPLAVACPAHAVEVGAACPDVEVLRAKAQAALTAAGLHDLARHVAGGIGPELPRLGVIVDALVGACLPESARHVGVRPLEKPAALVRRLHPRWYSPRRFEAALVVIADRQGIADRLRPLRGSVLAAGLPAFDALLADLEAS